jgi:hypothetical protein
MIADALSALAVAAIPSPSPEPQPYLRSVRDGLLYVLRDRTLRDVTLVAAVVWVFILPFETVVLNAHLQETGQVAAFGAILAAYAGGGIAGALGYGAIADRLPTRPTLAGAWHGAAAGLRGAAGGRGLSALARLTRPGQAKISSKNARIAAHDLRSATG